MKRFIILNKTDVVCWVRNASEFYSLGALDNDRDTDSPHLGSSWFSSTSPAECWTELALKRATTALFISLLIYHTLIILSLDSVHNRISYWQCR
jgi:hypothetical protein